MALDLSLGDFCAAFSGGNVGERVCRNTEELRLPCLASLVHHALLDGFDPAVDIEHRPDSNEQGRDDDDELADHARVPLTSDVSIRQREKRELCDTDNGYLLLLSC